MVQQSVLTTDWSSVGVFKTNLLLCSLKHTHGQKHTDLHTCTHADGYIQPTHTHTSYSFNLFLFVFADEKAGIAIRMDGRRRGQRSKESTKGGKKRVDG